MLVLHQNNRLKSLSNIHLLRGDSFFINQPTNYTTTVQQKSYKYRSTLILNSESKILSLMKF